MGSQAVTRETRGQCVLVWPGHNSTDAAGSRVGTHSPGCHGSCVWEWAALYSLNHLDLNQHQTLVSPSSITHVRRLPCLPRPHVCQCWPQWCIQSHRLHVPLWSALSDSTPPQSQAGGPDAPSAPGVRSSVDQLDHYEIKSFDLKRSWGSIVFV